METYMFKSVGIVALLNDYSDANLNGTYSKDGEKQKEQHEFVCMVEARIRKSIPSWSTAKLATNGKTSKEIKQPGEKQKIASGTITLTSGIKRVIPSNALGQITLIDSALAELEKAGIPGGWLPNADSYLDSSLVQFVGEFNESRRPTPVAPAPSSAPASSTKA